MRVSGLGLVLSVLLVAACGGDDTSPPTVSSGGGEDGGTSNRCIDNDGDGAGRRCGMADCDDDDPEITNECFLCTGSEPEEGCPCDEGTMPELCTPDNLNDTMMVNGQLLQCVEGARYCHQPAGVDPDTFVWGECMGVFRLVNN